MIYEVIEKVNIFDSKLVKFKLSQSQNIKILSKEKVNT